MNGVLLMPVLVGVFFSRARECVFIHVCVPVFIVAYHNIIDQAGSQTIEGFLFSRGDILGHYEHFVYVLWCFRVRTCVCDVHLIELRRLSASMLYDDVGHILPRLLNKYKYGDIHMKHTHINILVYTHTCALTHTHIHIHRFIVL